MNALPALVILALLFISFGMDCARHGQPKTGTYNGWVSLIAVCVSLALWWWIGIFDPLLKVIGHG